MSGVASCVAPSEPERSEHPRVSLHVSANAAALIATVGLRIEYLRTSGSPALLSDQTHTVPDGGGDLSVDIDIAPCLADPTHQGQPDECRVDLTVRVTGAGGASAPTQTVGPLSLREGQVTSVPPLVFDVSGSDSAATSVVVTPGLDSLLVGDTTLFTAQAFDSAGNVLVGRSAIWSSMDPAVVSILPVDNVTAQAVGVGPGTAGVVAMVDGVADTATVVVVPVQPRTRVASVVVTPALDSLIVGDTSQFVAQAFDSAGNPLNGRTATWASNDTTVVTVAPVDSVTGSAVAVGPGFANVVATIEGVADSAGVVVSHSAPTLMTGWFVGNATALDAGLIAFIDDTTYVLAVDGVPEPPTDPNPGQPGGERGVYSWANNGTLSGVLTGVAARSTLGGFGFGTQGDTVSIILSADGNTILQLDPSDPPDVWSRVGSNPTNPLVGTWVFENPTSPTPLIVLMILDDTNFFLGVDELQGATSRPGMERGTYSWDPGTGAFSIATSKDTSGDSGLNPLRTSGSANVSGNSLTYVTSQGTLVFRRLP